MDRPPRKISFKLLILYNFEDAPTGLNGVFSILKFLIKNGSKMCVVRLIVLNEHTTPFHTEMVTLIKTRNIVFHTQILVIEYTLVTQWTRNAPKITVLGIARFWFSRLVYALLQAFKSLRLALTFSSSGWNYECHANWHKYLNKMNK